MFTEWRRRRKFRLRRNASNRTHHASYLGEQIVRHTAKVTRLARLPVEAAHVFAKYGSMYGQSRRQSNLKLVAFNFAGNGTGKCNRGSQIEVPGRENNGWPLSGLLAARLRIKIEPDQIAASGTYGSTKPLPHAADPRRIRRGYRPHANLREAPPASCPRAALPVCAGLR